jgi:hypothetical protein
LASASGRRRRPRPAAPFSTWDYRPPYLPEQLAIQVATSSDRVEEPLLFIVSFGGRPDQAVNPEHRPGDHPAGIAELTRVTISGPYADHSSPELAAAAGTGCFSLQPAARHLLELGFDNEVQGRCHDLRPDLHLVIYW